MIKLKLPSASTTSRLSDEMRAEVCVPTDWAVGCGSWKTSGRGLFYTLSASRNNKVVCCTANGYVENDPYRASIGMAVIMDKEDVAKYYPKDAKPGTAFTCPDLEYPGNAPDEKTSTEILALLKADKLTYTGKDYGRNANGIRDYNKAFQVEKVLEILYNDKKYVVFPAKLRESPAILSNGQRVKDGELMVVEVGHPQFTLLDDGRALSNIIAAGFQFDYNKTYDGNEEKAHMYRVVLPGIAGDMRPSEVSSVARERSKVAKEPTTAEKAQVQNHARVTKEPSMDEDDAPIDMLDLHEENETKKELRQTYNATTNKTIRSALLPEMSRSRPNRKRMAKEFKNLHSNYWQARKLIDQDPRLVHSSGIQQAIASYEGVQKTLSAVRNKGPARGGKSM